MEHIDDIVSLLFFASFVVLVIAYRRPLKEAVEELIDQFRGGPPPPVHPSPAGDDRLLRHRAKRTES